MLSRLFHFLWGDISKEELKKFCLLGLGLLFTLMAFWILRPIKDVLFLSLVDKALLPYAKIASLATLVVALMLYAKLVDILEKHRLVYVITAFITIFLGIIATIIIRSPDIYTQYTFATKLLGWIAYIGCGCLLVILYSMIWSFINSSLNITSAKKGYPLIIIGAKIGGMAGSLCMLQAQTIGIGGLLIIAAGCVTGIAIIAKFFTHKYLPILTSTKKNELNPTGSLEGLRLFIKHPYLIGIFIISIMPDIIGEILNISMLFLADNSFNTPEQIAIFLGSYGIVANTATLIFATFGTGLFLRIWGINTWLLLYPCIMVTLIMYIWIFHSLWTIAIALALFKGLRYAIDQPCREILLIQTSKDILFKAKSWISAFGTHAGQGIGATLGAISLSLGGLALFGAFIPISLLCLWLPVTFYVRNINNKLMQSNDILR